MHTAEGEHEPLVDALTSRPRRASRSGCRSRRGEHQPRGPGVVADQLLRVEREQQHGREKPKPDHGHDDRADGEVAVAEDGQVEDRLARSARGSRSRRAPTATTAERHDQPRVEPVLALAAVEHELQAAEAQHHEDEPDVSMRPGRRRWASRTGTRWPGGSRQPDGDVDVEDPAPRPVVGDPPARPSGRRSGPARCRCPTPPSPCRAAASGKISQSTAWTMGITGPPPRPCRMRIATRNSTLGAMPERNELAGEDHGADQEEPPAAEHGGEPARGGQHDGVGGEIGGQHPGDLLHAGRERALDVGQGHVGDPGVQDLQHGDQHHREGDRPAMAGRERPRFLSPDADRDAYHPTSPRARCAGCLRLAFPLSPGESSPGTRCTTFTQLPVAFSGGRSEKRAPVPALIESMVPV